MEVAWLALSWWNQSHFLWPCPSLRQDRTWGHRKDRNFQMRGLWQAWDAMFKAATRWRWSAADVLLSWTHPLWLFLLCNCVDLFFSLNLLLPPSLVFFSLPLSSAHLFLICFSFHPFAYPAFTSWPQGNGGVLNVLYLLTKFQLSLFKANLQNMYVE